MRLGSICYNADNKINTCSHCLKKNVCDLHHSERPFAGTTGTGGTTKRRECGWHERLAWSPCTKRTRRSEAPTTSLTPTTGGKWPRNFTWSTTSWKIGQRCLRHFITTPTCQQRRLTSIGLRLGSFLISPFLFLFHWSPRLMPCGWRWPLWTSPPVSERQCFTWCFCLHFFLPSVSVWGVYLKENASIFYSTYTFHSHLISFA